MGKDSIIHFAKLLAGHFSNKEQAQSEPRNFAHINIYFRPLPWGLLNGPGFYSEQSYDYAPWSPYRQAIHKIVKRNDFFLIENFSIHNQERFAGSGFKADLLEKLNIKNLQKRNGCSMIFRETHNSSYAGNIEPGCKCLINRQGQKSYLNSVVELGKDKFISLDRGLDPSTHKQLWGSEHGPLIFRKIIPLGDHLDQEWRDCL